MEDNNPFVLKEILRHIISFVPRNNIIPVAFVCKNFHDSIKIDYDQENIARNGDMFSLLKVIHSPIVVMNIATCYGHYDMVEYLLNKFIKTFMNMNEKLMNDATSLDNMYMCQILPKSMRVYFDDSVCYNIGRSGNKKLLKILDHSRTPRLYTNAGLCEGGHTELISIENDDSLGKIYTWIRAACRGGHIVLDNVVEFIKNNRHGFHNFHEDNINKCIEFYDFLLNEFNIHFIVDYIKKPDNKYLIDLIIGELIERNDCNNFRFFVANMEKEQKYVYGITHSLIKIIQQNNYEMFECVLAELCDSFHSYGAPYGRHYSGEYHTLIVYCIHYRRIDMYRCVLNYSKYNIQLDDHKKYLSIAQNLGFDEMVDVISLSSNSK